MLNLDLIVLLCIIHVAQGFISQSYQLDRVFGGRTHKLILLSNEKLETAPSEYPEKARLQVIVSGGHATNALFRAELKKELTFFRGCPGCFSELNPEKALIVAEGKCRQLEKFIGWLKGFSTPLVQRKPSFQGPSLMITIDDLQWSPFSGDLTGFTTTSTAPQLSSLVSEDDLLVGADSTIDVRAMTGTDESV